MRRQVGTAAEPPRARDPSGALALRNSDSCSARSARTDCGDEARRSRRRQRSRGPPASGRCATTLGGSSSSGHDRRVDAALFERCAVGDDRVEPLPLSRSRPRLRVPNVLSELAAPFDGLRPRPRSTASAPSQIRICSLGPVRYGAPAIDAEGSGRWIMRAVGVHGSTSCATASRVRRPDAVARVEDVRAAAAPSRTRCASRSSRRGVGVKDGRSRLPCSARVPEAVRAAVRSVRQSTPTTSAGQLRRSPASGAKRRAQRRCAPRPVRRALRGCACSRECRIRGTCGRSCSPAQRVEELHGLRAGRDLHAQISGSSESVSFSSSGCIAAGSARKNARKCSYSLLPPPSTRYAARVSGAPAKPIRATSAASSRRTMRSASPTNGAISSRSAQRLDLRRRTQRLGIVRPRRECDLDAQRFERRHDVAEDDGRIERETPDGLKRDLGRQFRACASSPESANAP